MSALADGFERRPHGPALPSPPPASVAPLVELLAKEVHSALARARRAARRRDSHEEAPPDEHQLAQEIIEASKQWPTSNATFHVRATSRCSAQYHIELI